MAQKVEIVTYIVNQLRNNYPNAKINAEIRNQFKNMKYELDKRPEIVEIAIQASKNVGVVPFLLKIRGGLMVLGHAIYSLIVLFLSDFIDISYFYRLTEKGLLCPNIFAGCEHFHSRTELVPINSMDKATEVVFEIVRLFLESKKK
ncbi:MAG: putative peptidase T [Streblomastix strix]|uniref:Putative peptidase T n=1 Tax=Streblomastix strix TaxID=222440 RepID=A0A5J4WZY4_9EUKA|nr:MAG: putative peptidase T [Streblomastix strix]